MDRVSADHMGIMATIMNALAMQGVLKSKGIDARVLSAIAMPTVCETYSPAKGIHHLEKGRVVICAAGTGLPFFTTDTGSALRAAELQCNALFKGTSVDGVYAEDPKRNPQAKRFEKITFSEILSRDLRIMTLQQSPLHGTTIPALYSPSVRQRLEGLNWRRPLHTRDKGLVPWLTPLPSTPPTSSAACTAPRSRSSTILVACAPGGRP
jgi:hypothetical protein